MSLSKHISVNTHYTRSVNLERDEDSAALIKSYIPTSRSLRTLARVSGTFNQESIPRSWSLIGPYGSGKSAFSIFLSHLLSAPDLATTKSAFQVLRRADKQLPHVFTSATKNKSGFLKILVTGAPEPMSERILASMVDAAEKFWQGRKGKKPAILKKLRDALNTDLAVSDVLKLIQEFQDQLKKTDCAGILIVIDELGKFLEYEARHYGANDIYLLQALAEHACKGQEVNLYLFALLHQSFEQYAKGLGENLKNEWSKVQGRFEEVPFLEASEQVLRVVSAAFDASFNKEQANAIHKKTLSIVKALDKTGALPNALDLEGAEKLFQDCYPLHPVSAILLPVLCQKVAQNERTLFSYLGSHEDFGFQQLINDSINVGEFIYPHHVFDYFITNQSAVIGDHRTHRRWVEVITAIERIGDAKSEVLQLLKTIGLLNIIGAKGGFKASKPLLIACFKSKAAFNNAIETLEKASVVTYRKFNTEYRVWQGSDFDLEDAVRAELDNLGKFSLADELAESKPLLPVVARKYTIQNGALRYFTPVFIDAKNYSQIKNKSDEPRIIFYLAAGQDDEAFFFKTVAKRFSSIDVIALCLSGNQLYEALAEVEALRRVQRNAHKLDTDPIAKREFEDRFTSAEKALDILLQDLINAPEKNKWFSDSDEKTVVSKRGLQQIMSDVLSQAYSKAPMIHNELINRDRLSAQAVGARNKLLYMMLNKADSPDLGIEKFPPEKAIYRSLLLATGLHQKDSDGKWVFVAPSKPNKSSKTLTNANMYYVWSRIDAFMASTEAKPKSFIELNKELQAPPYGVKAGTLPVIFIAYYIVHQHEIALYEGATYRPYFTEEMLERFIKRPVEYEFQRFRIQGLKASVFSQYSQVLFNDAKERTLLELAKPLAAFMGKLPEYTQKTRRGLSDQANKVRTAFNLAKSPERLLFQELPKALGFTTIQNSASEEDLSGFAEALTKALRELNQAHAVLIEREQSLLAQAFTLPASTSLVELRDSVRGMCIGLDQYTVDTQGVRALLTRLTNKSGDNKAWLENVLMFLGHKPTKSWQDADQDTAEHRLNDFARRIIDLQKLSIHSRDMAQKDDEFDVYLLRSLKQGGDFNDEVVVIDQNKRSYISDTKAEIKRVIAGLNDRELKLAALAEIVDEFLIDYKNEQSTTGNTSKSSSEKNIRVAKEN